MALKECIAADVRNICTFSYDNVFKECHMTVLHLLQIKDNTNSQAFMTCTGIILHLLWQLGMCNKCCTNQGEPVPSQNYP